MKIENPYGLAGYRSTFDELPAEGRSVHLAIRSKGLGKMIYIVRGYRLKSRFYQDSRGMPLKGEVIAWNYLSSPSWIDASIAAPMEKSSRLIATIELERPMEGAIEVERFVDSVQYVDAEATFFYRNGNEIGGTVLAWNFWPEPWNPSPITDEPMEGKPMFGRWISPKVTPPRGNVMFITYRDRNAVGWEVRESYKLALNHQSESWYDADDRTVLDESRVQAWMPFPDTWRGPAPEGIVDEIVGIW